MCGLQGSQQGNPEQRLLITLHEAAVGGMDPANEQGPRGGLSVPVGLVCLVLGPGSKMETDLTLVCQVLLCHLYS